MFNVHTPGNSPNLTIAQGQRYLERAIRLGVAKNRSRILVIHGHNGKRKAWLSHLKKNYDLGPWRNNNPGVSILYLRNHR